MKIFKRVFALLIVLTFIFGGFASTSYASETIKEIDLKDSKGNQVYHYGTGKKVTVPQKYLEPEYEMRGVWVATVYNIAMGKQPGATAEGIEAYQQEFLAILDRMEEYNMNTLYFQVRPSNDAFYESELNTWSQFLVGAGIDPGWDPLEWMVEETHKRGFTFQCWLNAFRVTVYSVLPDSNKKANNYSNDQLVKFKEQALSTLVDGNLAKEHPEYVVMGESDTRLILNPSEPAVQDFIVETVMEIFENYDVDGLHFDDYFYLSGDVSSNTSNTNFAGGKTYNSSYTGSKLLNDLPNYEAYKNGDSKYSAIPEGLSLGDFRRESLNVMMRKIRARLDEYNLKNNENKEFGSKPAAVWRSNVEYCTTDQERCTVNGSNTAANAYTSYNDLYADSLKWVQEGLVDYVAPQVYYAFTDKYAPYADIVEWWANQVSEINEANRAAGKKEVKLYIAHGIYKYRDNPDQFSSANEIINQIKYNQKFDSIKGSAFYSYENLYLFEGANADRLKQAMSYLKNNWKTKVLPAPLGTSDDSEGLVVNEYNVKHNLLDDSYTITFDRLPNAGAYIIYKALKGETINPEDVSSRELVKFAGYVENGKVDLRLYEYDENYDYYLKVASKNYFLSKDSTKLNLGNAIEYESIKILSISSIDDLIPKSTTINFSVTTKYEDVGTLTYQVYIDDGVKRLIKSGTVTNNLIEVSWKSYAVETKKLRFEIVITDGDLTVTGYTNYFDIGVIPPKEYQINYELDGGILSDDSAKTYLENIGLSILPTPTKEGYEFKGWMLNDQIVTSIDPTLNKDITLVATWKEIEQPKKGCKKSSMQFVISLTSLISLMSIGYFRRKH